MGAKVAFVVDALSVMAGGERVILRALELFPGAPVYTMAYNPTVFANTLLSQHPVIPSMINRLPMSHTHYRGYLPMMLYAVRKFDLSQFDLVISFSYAVAHGARVRSDQRHVSYTYTPLRYAWRNFMLGQRVSPDQWLVKWFFRFFRQWDARVVTQVDRFAAVSRDIAGWIQRVYQREAQVIYPPVDLERFQPQFHRDGYFMTISRLVPYKHIDLIVQAFSCLRLPLIIVGDGPELAHLRQIASPNITFAGYQPDPVVAHLLNRARGYVCAAEEDFGIAMVEAQAAGCPVIAYKKGGALETVIEGKTGLFYNEQSRDSLIEAIEQFECRAASFCISELVSNVQKFSKERFLNKFSAFVDWKLP